MSKENKKTSVLFVHPCLGIGGGEQLMVSAALSFKNELNYDAQFIVTEFDPNRCFPELLTDFNVVTCGSFLPRDIRGRFVVFCHSVQLFYLFFYTWLLYLFYGIHYDIVFIDNFPIFNTLFKLVSNKVFFYCHFPFKKKKNPSSSNLLYFYKQFWDYIEEKTMFSSNVVCFNSKFTKNTAKSLFLAMKTKETHILYPPVNLTKIMKTIETVKDWSAMVSMFPEELKHLKSKKYVLSLNRYGKFKKIERALFAFQEYHKQNQDTTTTTLVIAGGYDICCRENKEIFDFLELKAQELMKTSRIQIIFLKNLPDLLRWCLLFHAATLIYTPSFEHFGIVPVESMAMGVPPIVCKSGGVLESVVHNKTGYWCIDTDEKTVITEFANTLKKILSRSEDEIKQQSLDCQKHVQQHFTFEIFARNFKAIMDKKTV